MEPEQVYRCPKCQKVLGYDLVKARQHTNIPDKPALPAGLVFKHPGKESYFTTYYVVTHNFFHEKGYGKYKFLPMKGRTEGHGFLQDALNFSGNIDGGEANIKFCYSGQEFIQQLDSANPRVFDFRSFTETSIYNLLLAQEEFSGLQKIWTEFFNAKVRNEGWEEYVRGKWEASISCGSTINMLAGGIERLIRTTPELEEYKNLRRVNRRKHDRR